MNGDSYKYIRHNLAQETRWATREEIEHSCAQINLNDDNYNASGLPVLSNGTTAYVDNTDTHSLIFGATGSKKTRLFCMPMINMFIKAGESFVVTDPKGEIYVQSSGLAKKYGYNVVVLNFRDIGKGDRWNPFSIPRVLWREGKKDDAGLLLSDFVSAIAANQVMNNNDAFWPEAAQSIALANLYVLMEAAKDNEINLTSFTRLCSLAATDDLATLNKMIDKDTVVGLNYQSTVSLGTNSKTRDSMIATLNGMLRFFNLNRKLMAMLSENTFDVREFGRRKSAVYIIIPDEKTTFNFLITTFIKQAYEILIAEAQKEKSRQLPKRVNFVLDEFCNIPKIPDMPSMISAARSRNMRFFLVAQSMHQLNSRYGQEDADTIKGNCVNWVFLASKELALLNEISELCGNVIDSNGRLKRLISSSELQRLNKEKGEALILHDRQYPIISELTDISGYKMFGTEAPVEMTETENFSVKTFSIEKLLQDIGELKAVAPFASLKHLNSQAKKIYSQEQRKILSKHNGGQQVRHTSFRMDNIEALDSLDAQTIEEIKIKTRERIAKLISPEFADEFISDLESGRLDETDDDNPFSDW